VPEDVVSAARRRGEDVKIERNLIALDLETGKDLWRTEGVPESRWQHVMYSPGVVVAGGNAAYDAKSGRMLWTKEIESRRIPLIHGHWLIAQPHAYSIRTGAPRMESDILTGEERPWRPIGFGDIYHNCGQIAGSQNMLYYRSGNAGFFDLANDGTTTFKGVRTACATGQIAANGIVLMPYSGSGCACSYNFQASMALVPSERMDRDHWFAFEGEKSTLPIRRLHLNFGAPGDRNDPRGDPWLGYPRPDLEGAAPVGVRIGGDGASYYYTPDAKIRKGGGPRWVYTSGLRNPGRLKIDLVSIKPVVISPKAGEPVVDGVPSDGFWEGVKPVQFEHDEHVELPRTTLLARRNRDNIYLSCRREASERGGRPVPFIATQTGRDAECWRDDELEIMFTDERKQMFAQFGVSCAGGRFEGKGELGKFGDKKWNGSWSAAVQRGTREWSAEIAVPIRTLEEAGLDTRKLWVNAMSQGLGSGGRRRIHLADPGEKGFDRCEFFRPVADRQLPPRSVTVRLHFADPEFAGPGRRVFDVLLGGRKVLADFDIAGRAGGRNTALAEEFAAVEVGTQVALDFVAKIGEPLICGIEIVAEER
jgi:hypothetical protein